GDEDRGDEPVEAAGDGGGRHVCDAFQEAGLIGVYGQYGQYRSGGGGVSRSGRGLGAVGITKTRKGEISGTKRRNCAAGILAVGRVATGPFRHALVGGNPSRQGFSVLGS